MPCSQTGSLEPHKVRGSLLGWNEVGALSYEPGEHWRDSFGCRQVLLHRRILMNPMKIAYLQSDWQRSKLDVPTPERFSLYSLQLGLSVAG